jgi:ferredoxin-type protein NapG
MSEEQPKKNRSLPATAGRAGIIGSLLAGLAAIRGSVPAQPGERGAWGIVRPPGAREETSFLSLCLRCNRCADACETQCIRFFGMAAGRLRGTPYIIPRELGCNLCLECTQTCPSGALQVREKKEEVKMGLAEVDERLCVSHNGTGVCGACHTVCPLRNRAITQNLRNQPEIHTDDCTGCGLCEEICIVRDRRAIRVRTERRHDI